jgi:NADPH2:quinone reductase
MRAWLLDDFKGLGCLQLAEVETPKPGDGDVLVRLRFAALNPADRFLAENLYPARPALPHILGRDGMGVVQSVGAEVKSVRPGDRACILRGDAGVTQPGTFAEFVVVPEVAVAAAPIGWTDEEAAAGPLVYLTAYQALQQWGPLEKATVLITGISGGVGLASLHLAKTFGHKVIGTTRGTGKAARLREFGADLLVDPDDPELRNKVKEFTSRKGVDLIIDNIAGDLFNVLMDTLGYGGRVSVVGMLGGLVPNFNTAKLLFKRARIGGVLVTDYKGERAQKIWPEIVTRLDAANQRPVVDSTFPFEGLLAAFDRLAAGPFGKVLIAV